MAAAGAAMLLVVIPPEPVVVPQYKITAAGTAGGLRKEGTLPEAAASYPFIIAAARAGGAEPAVTARAVYRDPVTNAQDVLFLGGMAQIGDPAAFLQRARPSTALTVAETIPAKKGGQISCGTFAVLSATHLYCAWATTNTFGFIASNDATGEGRPAGLAALTARIRTDLEKRTN